MRRSILIGVAIFVIIIGIFVLIARRGTPPEQSAEVARKSSLLDFAVSGTEMRFTVSGQINARENHRVIQIQIGKDSRSIQIFDGYQGNVLQQQSFLNDKDAYKAFLSALENEGYTRSRPANKNVDPLGACPLGQRFRFDIIEGANTKQSLWATTCGNARGTFNGRRGTIVTLFQQQIPNYRDVTRGVQL